MKQAYSITRGAALAGLTALSGGLAAAAKLTATRPLRSLDRGFGCDRIEWTTLHKIEHLGGVV